MHGAPLKWTGLGVATAASLLVGCGFSPKVSGDGGIVDAIDASHDSSDGASELPRNCKELHATSPALPSGSYVIDPDGPGGDDKLAVTCDMTTDGGGWTIVFYPASANLTSVPLQYTVSTPRLMTDATAALIAFRDFTQSTASSYATFALPDEWRIDTPFNYAGNDLPIMASINSGGAVATTLKFGRGSFGSVRCDGGWSAGAYGKVCIATTAAPFFSGFADPSQDYCTSSLSDWNTAGCSNNLKFSIAVR